MGEVRTLESVKDEIELLKSLIRGISQQFGDRCEVVLHDLTGDYDSTIIAIENGHITGRNVGDPGSNLGLEVLRGSVKEGDRYNYLTQTKKGKILRSSTVYIKNKNQEPIGAVCINLDISDFMMAENVINSITMKGMDQDIKEVFVNDVNELLDFFLQECQNEIGKPVSHMTKEEKIHSIEFLDKRGAFLIKKAGDKVCKYFDISKFTLYSYLDNIRS